MPASSGPPTQDDLLDTVVRLLARTCRELGDAGEPVRASRLAASGWVALRHEHPGHAERLNGAMHYLARLENTLEAPSTAKGHHDDHHRP